jgi:hypothetical protein
MQVATATTPPEPAFSFPWVSYTPSVPPEYQIQKDAEIRQVSDIHQILMLPLDELNTGQLLRRLLTKNKLPLQFVCYSLKLLDVLGDTNPSNAKTKQQLGKLLVAWVSHAASQ